MPERPELDYYVPILREALVGRTITAARVRDPVVVRVAVPGELVTLLPGLQILSVERRSHMVCVGLGSLQLTVAPMLAGRFSFARPGAKDASDLCVALCLDDGPDGASELRYRDDVRMGKVTLHAPNDLGAAPGLDAAGLDVRNPRVFTVERLKAVAKGRRDQVKNLLLDKYALDALGNAYADEALWAAGIHPKTAVNKLDDAAFVRLHAGIRDTIEAACAEIERRTPPIDEKLRDFLAVRNRAGKACPKCATIVRKVGVNGHDAFFCPRCQPDGGRGFIDWTKVPP